MKNLFVFAAAAFVAVSVAACSKSNDEIIEGGGNAGFKLSFTAVANSDSAAAQTADADTRLSFATGTDGKGLKASWTTDDQLDVYVGSVTAANKATFSCAKINDDGTAVFSGTLKNAPQVGDKIYAYYQYYNNYISSDRYRYATYSIQTGDVAKLKEYCLMYAETTYGESMSLQFKHLYSVLKLTFTFPDLAAGAAVNSLGIKAAGGLYSSVALDATNGYALYGYYSSPASSLVKSGTATLDANKQVTVYLRTMYGIVTDIYGTATVGTQAYVSKVQLAASLNMAAGKVYAKSDIEMEPYSEVATSFAGGDGSVDTPYEISNVKELRYMAQLMNATATYGAYNKKYYKLTADIDLGDGSIEWSPIADKMTVVFLGTFDGCGHTISGMMKCATGTYGGLFGYVGSGSLGHCAIKNVNMTCTIDGSNVSSACAGIVAYSGSGCTIVNCTNAGDITTAARNVGGIMGSAAVNTTFQLNGCTNTGNIECTANSVAYVGGVIGQFSFTGTSLIAGCINKGAIKYSGSQATTRVAGVAAAVIDNGSTATDVVSCWSSANTITTTNYKGTVVGQASNCVIQNCYYHAISGFGVLYNWKNSSSSSCDTFTDDAPSAAQIEAMNTAWASADSAREYRFNAQTGAVEENK